MEPGGPHSNTWLFALAIGFRPRRVCAGANAKRDLVVRCCAVHRWSLGGGQDQRPPRSGSAPFALLGVWRDDAPETPRSLGLGAWDAHDRPARRRSRLDPLGGRDQGLPRTRPPGSPAAALSVVELRHGRATSRGGPVGARRRERDLPRRRLRPPSGRDPDPLFAVERRQLRFWAWIAVTLAGPVVVFFNLYYVHDYYSTAVTASVAALVGGGFAALAAMRSAAARVVLVVAVAISVAGWVVNISYWTRTFETAPDPDGVLPLAAQISRETSPTSTSRSSAATGHRRSCTTPTDGAG